MDGSFLLYLIVCGAIMGGFGVTASLAISSRRLASVVPTATLDLARRHQVMLSKPGVELVDPLSVELTFWLEYRHTHLRLLLSSDGLRELVDAAGWELQQVCEYCAGSGGADRGLSVCPTCGGDGWQPAAVEPAERDPEEDRLDG